MTHRNDVIRYVVRAKRGTVQSAQDGKSGTKQPKSAGANIRRYNEVALNQDVQSLIAGWTEHLATCDIIFLQAPVRSRTTFYNSKESGGRLEKGDPRIRSIPFTTGRPVLRELQRIHAILSAVYHVGDPADNFVDEDAGGDGGDSEGSDAGATNAAAKAKAKAKREAAAAAAAAALAAATALPDARFSNSPLYLAALTGDIASVVKVLSDPDRQGGFDLDFAWNDGAETAMHAASRVGAADVVALLLEKGACPSFLDQMGRPPFVVAENKEVRNTLRRYMATHPGRWNYKAAQIPSALTAEMEAKQAEKAKEEKKRQKERKKIKDKAQAEADAVAAAEKAAADAKAAKILGEKEAARQAAAAEKARLAKIKPRDMCAAAALARFEKKGSAAKPTQKEPPKAELVSDGTWAAKGAKGIDIQQGWDERPRFGAGGGAGGGDGSSGGGGKSGAAAAGTAAPEVVVSSARGESAPPPTTMAAKAAKLVAVKLLGIRPGAKMKLVKQLKKVLPKLGLAAAKKFVESLPQTVQKDLSPEDAGKMRKSLEGAGGKVKLEVQ